MEKAIEKREKAIIAELQEKQAAINDRTGKGLATENVIERALIRPFLTPRFDLSKGAVVTSANPEQQSPAIDRVIFDKTAAPPLMHDLAHSAYSAPFRPPIPIHSVHPFRLIPSTHSV